MERLPHHHNLNLSLNLNQNLNLSRNLNQNLKVNQKEDPRPTSSKKDFLSTTSNVANSHIALDLGEKMLD